MSVEIEKKYRVGSGRRARIEATLHDLGAEFVGREFEENVIFSGDALGDTGGIVRIRRIGSRSILTYKRRLESSLDVKKQIEHEVEVSDGDTATAILRELGLRPKLVYEKYRETWRMRSVEVVVDELPFGEFMEIEGSITAIREAEILLELDDLETETATYPLLTSQHGRDKDGVVEARFG